MTSCCSACLQPEVRAAHGEDSPNQCQLAIGHTESFSSADKTHQLRPFGSLAERDALLDVVELLQHMAMKVKLHVLRRKSAPHQLEDLLELEGQHLQDQLLEVLQAQHKAYHLGPLGHAFVRICLFGGHC